jgi:NAD+ synthase (glutamine-hydrolysing)
MGNTSDLEHDDRAFRHGMLRITASSAPVRVGDPVGCARGCEALIEEASDADILLLPELAIGGYTCGDLFGTDAHIKGVIEGVDRLCDATRGRRPLVVVGAPIVVDDALFNTAVVIAGGRVCGIVPKQYLPTYREFYEARHFRPADGTEPEEIVWSGELVPFGIDLLFELRDAVIGVEICEDLWVPIPPSSLQSLAGANVLLNLSASNEVIQKAAWRRELVLSQSGRCIAAYAYASSGPDESTTDLVFGGHCLIAENGGLLGESRRVGDSDQPLRGITSITADIDLQRLSHDRRVTQTFPQGRRLVDRQYRRVLLDPPPASIPAGAMCRHVEGRPFVPQDPQTLDQRCAEVLGIQAAGLAKRVSRLPADSPLVIGISGGLDSTLAALVATRVCDDNGWPRSRIVGLTMPGFGTTTGTLRNAERLIRLLGLAYRHIDIRQLALDTFRGIGHRPLGVELADGETVASLQAKLVGADHRQGDLTLENVQARLRTFLLMTHGFVIGTGDLSEQALGWSTYNADHMSMYGVNTSIPKTLVRFLVRHVAGRCQTEELAEVLISIADTPVSPELLPPDVAGRIRQDTEAMLGPYELHDFILYHFVRHGATREKIRYLAGQARFEKGYSPEEIDRTLETFFRRFFASQYKRSCVPDGPKVGSVTLSPRGDWRMPSDADSDAH